MTTVAIVVPKMQETARQTTCMNNLSQLGQVYLMQAQENQGRAQKYSGVALWLSYRKNASEIKRGDERVLLCPGDVIPMPDTEDEKKRWDNADLDNPPGDLCSYSARDFKNFPMNVESKDKEIIGSDREGPDGKTNHHKGVIICVFAAGDAQKMTREELGLASDTTHGIVIGPEAESKMLQKVIYKASKHE